MPQKVRSNLIFWIFKSKNCHFSCFRVFRKFTGFLNIFLFLHEILPQIVCSNLNFWIFIDTVSIQYRYSIDTVSILYRYSINIACRKPKTGCVSGRKTEAQVPLGSENRSTGGSGVGKPKHRRASGSILGRFGGVLGWLWWVRKKSERVPGDRTRPKKMFSFPEVKNYETL